MSLLSEVIAPTSILTEDNAKTLTNKTLVDPVVTLQSSQGTTGQVAISQGALVPPIWHTLVPSDVGAEPADATILKDADIGVNVQAYNINTVVDSSYVHTDNNYTTTEKNKLAGIEANATADQTASEILTAIKTVDGTTSGLDADLLDGQEGSYYLDYTNFTNTPTITYNDDTNSNYQMLWGNGNNAYGTAGIYCNPSTDYMYAVAFSASSDGRLKDNISTITNGLAKVLGMRGVSFTRISNGKQEIGVIAQEVKEVVPEVVDKGNGDMLSVSYGNLVGVLIEAIKEQQQLINLQEKRLLKLEDFVNSIK